ncbi:MAG TPA: GntR family transcriptional regulator [Bordetella sp.]
MSENPLPLYHQVYLLLKQRLAAGQYIYGAPMPGENALAAEYGVSRLTVRRSLEALEAEGLIQRRQGRGTFAAPPAADGHSADIDALMTHLDQMGMQTQVRLLDLQVVPASAQAAERLALAPGAPVSRSVRVRSHDGLPFSYLTTHVPHEIGQRIPRELLGSRPLLAIFHDLGIEAAHAEQAISATLAEPAAAAALDIPVGSALLSLHRLVRDATGRPVEWLHALYRPDRYEYRMHMQAYGTSGEPTWLPARPEPLPLRA